MNMLLLRALVADVWTRSDIARRKVTVETRATWILVCPCSIANPFTSAFLAPVDVVDLVAVTHGTVVIQ